MQGVYASGFTANEYRAYIATSTTTLHLTPLPPPSPGSAMTGFSALPGASAPSFNASWSGVGRVKGPRWAQMPLLTIGMLGLQIVWSVEMGYGERCFCCALCEREGIRADRCRCILNSAAVLTVARSLKVSHVYCIRGWAPERPDNAAAHWCTCRQLELTVWEKEALHDRWMPCLYRRVVALGLHSGVLEHLRVFRYKSRKSNIPRTSNAISSEMNIGYFQNDVLTIAFAVWSIYCIDFSINAGESTHCFLCHPSLAAFNLRTVQFRLLIGRCWWISYLHHSRRSEMPGLGECSGWGALRDSSCTYIFSQRVWRY